MAKKILKNELLDLRTWYHAKAKIPDCTYCIFYNHIAYALEGNGCMSGITTRRAGLPDDRPCVHFLGESD